MSGSSRDKVCILWICLYSDCFRQKLESNLAEMKIIILYINGIANFFLGKPLSDIRGQQTSFPFALETKEVKQKAVIQKKTQNTTNDS